MKNLKFVLAGLFCLTMSISPMFVSAQGCVSCLGQDPECYRIITAEGPHIFYGEKKACPNQ